MKSNKILSNILFFNLIVLVTIIGDFFKNFLPLSFIIILITYFCLSLSLLTYEIIQKQIKLLFSKIILLSTILIIGYADFYFKLSRSYSYVFKDNMMLSAIDSIYFSITTFTTTGFGDIYPISHGAKMFVASETIFGYILSTFIMAILIIKFMDEK